MPLHCNKPSSQVMTDNFWKLTGLSGSTKRDLEGHVGGKIWEFSFLPYYFCSYSNTAGQYLLEESSVTNLPIKVRLPV